ncbi:MAG: hypothetical protein ABIF08_02745 [Nanoarchaeota archaeon]
MKGEISRGIVTGLIVVLVLVSVIGASAVLSSISATDVPVALEQDKDSGTVGANIKPPNSITVGEVSLTVTG